MRAIDFFSGIYVINLPERRDRLRHITAELSRLEMPTTSQRVHVVAGIRPETKEPFRKLGSKGCYLTTLGILKRARAEGLERILILQDDALFSHAFAEKQAQMFDALSHCDWDLCQFGYDALPDDEQSRRFCEESPHDPGTLVPFSGEVIGAHCFAVNGKSLDRFISFLEELLTRPLGHRDGGPMPIDGAMNVFSWRSGVTRLVASPSLVGQVSSASDVTPRLFDQLPLLRIAASVARQVRLVSGYRPGAFGLRAK